MKKHTPGPWTVVSQHDPPESMSVIHIDSSEANARLIAAAPDLLEACKMLIKPFSFDGGVDIAKAAIAKAEPNTDEDPIEALP